MSQTVPGTGIKQQAGDPSEDDGKPGSPYLVADSRDVDTWNVTGDGEEFPGRGNKKQKGPEVAEWKGLSVHGPSDGREEETPPTGTPWVRLSLWSESAWVWILMS